MKKLLISALALLLLVGCNTTPTSEEPTTEPAEETTEETTTETTAEATGVQVGIGSVTSLKVTDAGEKDGSIQANTTIAALVVKDGVIADLDIDVAQNAAKFDATGKLTSDPAAETPSKKEKGDAYGMKAASGIGKEWFEQIAAFEEYAVGKTVEEVLAIPTYVKDDSHQAVPEAEDLKTSVTVDIAGYKAAIEAASKNLTAVEGVAKVGVANSTKVDRLADAGEKEGSARFNTVYALVAVDADGKIVYIDIDNAQNAGSFDTTGVVTTDATAATPTKTEKADAYGMKAASGIGKEWYEQMAAFEEYATGKTVEEVLATPTYAKDEGHPAVPESEDLKTAVTIDIGDYLATIEKANANLVEVK